MGNRSRWLVGLLVSALALAAALWGIHPDQILGALQGADFLFLSLALAALVLSLVFRALRWRVLLGHDVPLGRSWSVLNIGYLVNTVLPLRVGELARAYLISRNRPFGGLHALSSVALERVLDLLSVVFLLGVALAFVRLPAEIAGAGIVAAAIAFGGLLAMLAAALLPGTAQRAGDAVIARVFRASAPAWSRRWAGALAGLSSLREPRRLGAVLLWTAATWLCSVGTTYAGARAFLPHVPLPTAVFVLAALGLGVAVPSSPGQIGVYEATARYAFVLTGVADNTALAIGLVLHALNLGSVLAFGAVALAQEGESLRRLATETGEWFARVRVSPNRVA